MIVLRSEFVENKFSELLGLYSATFLKIKALVCKSVHLQTLKAQIEDQFPYLEENIEFAQTKEEVMTLFRKQQCKFPHFVELRGLVCGLDLDEAVRQVDRFEERKTELYNIILAKDFAKIKLQPYNRNQDVQVGYTARLKFHVCYK